MRLLIALLAVFVSFTAPAFSDDVTASQNVIRAQEQAFRQDDGATAYSFASPSIKSMYQTSDSFMDMVRNGFAPVYRHRSFEFGEAKDLGGMIAQIVHIVDADGIPWDALYTLEPQPDGSMKISSCTLKKLAGA